LKVCLPAKYEEPRGRKLTVVGWGRVGEDKDPSRVLKQVDLDLIDEGTRGRQFKVAMVGYPNGFTIYKSQLCAYTKSKDACQVLTHSNFQIISSRNCFKGDSGGPAIQIVNGRAVLVGVVSFGVGCATDFPGLNLTKL